MVALVDELQRREKIAATQRVRWEADLAARRQLVQLREYVAGGGSDAKRIGRELDTILDGLRGGR